MKIAAWKTWVQAGVLAVSLMLYPIVAPINAQQRDPTVTDTRPITTADNDGFPWGLLGLLGLFGLAGMKRRHNVEDHRRVDEPIRRTS